MAFDKSAYKLKYYHTHTDRDGRIVRLEVWIHSIVQYVSYRMCELSGLQLEIQGAQGDVDAAIVKSSLRFSLIDCPDKTTTATEKHGDWGEFYTPDSTKYLVVLKTMEPGATTYVTRWSGYITPDSWQESLDYHGEVTITARDNIGHLADFAFDAEGSSNGLISVFDIVESALAKVDCPMALVWDAIDLAGQGYKTVTDADGKRLREMLLNVEAFEGQSWYDVLETVLGDLGLCLRYIDNNQILCTSVANLHLLGAGDGQDSPRRTPVFLNGTLTLNPPYRKMIDRLSYDFSSSIDYAATKGLNFNGETQELPYHIEKYPQGLYVSGIQTVDLINNTGVGWQGSGQFYNIEGYDFSETDIAPDVDIRTACAIAANVSQNIVSDKGSTAIYNFGAIKSGSISIKFEYSNLLYIVGNIDGHNIYPLKKAFIGSVDYALRLRLSNGTYRYWNMSNGAWGTSRIFQTSDSGEVIIDISAAEIPEIGGELSLEVRARAAYVENEPGITDFRGLAWFLKSLRLESAFDGLQNYQVTTEPAANVKYNLVNDKNCSIGPIYQPTDLINCRSYMNALWRNAATPAAWQWKLTDGTLMPLPSLIHLQRLMLHGVTKQILEGDAVVADGKGFAFNALYDYRGKVYIITSGTLDLIRGEMSVTLYEL